LDSQLAISGVAHEGSILLPPISSLLGELRSTGIVMAPGKYIVKVFVEDSPQQQQQQQ